MQPWQGKCGPVWPAVQTPFSATLPSSISEHFLFTQAPVIIHLPNNPYEACLLDQLTQTSLQKSAASLPHPHGSKCTVCRRLYNHCWVPQPASSTKQCNSVQTCWGTYPDLAVYKIRYELCLGHWICCCPACALTWCLNIEFFCSDDNWYHTYLVHWACL